MKKILLAFLLLYSTVFAQAPALTINQNIATLTISATGSQPFTYQWYKNDRAITGATSNTLQIDISRETGIFYVIVSNSAGSAKSEDFRIVIARVAPADTTITKRVAR